LSSAVDASAHLPALPYPEWEQSKETLHLWAQIVGKVGLATTHPRNHWWNVTLLVDVRGLTTHRLHTNGTTFSIGFDFVDHRLVVRTHRGEIESFALENGLSVAAFDAQLHAVLRTLRIDVDIREEPFGVPMTTPFREDTEHRSYDADYVHRFWRALDWIDDVFDEFASWSTAKTSPVHLFWHSFDLAVTRFSGRSATAPGFEDVDGVTREAYSHELVSFGFWAGDRNVREPMFYSYTAPEPEGLREHPLAPREAAWQEGPTGSLALLPYDAVRSSGDPRSTLLAFLQSAYDAGTAAAGWPREELVSTWCPSPDELAALARRVRAV
jgi:hypothetical protein